MRAHALLNLSNELRKIDKMRGLPSILSLLHNELDKFIISGTNVRFYDFESHFEVNILRWTS